jgi:hypothetical protein
VDPLTIMVTSLLPSLVAVVTSDETKDLVARLRARAVEAELAKANVDEAVVGATRTDDVLAQIEQGSVTPETIAATDLREQIAQLVHTIGEERARNGAFVSVVGELVSRLDAQLAQEQAASLKNERRALIGTAVGVIGSLVGIATLVVAIVAL